MSGGIEKITEDIERLAQLYYDNARCLSVHTATRMLAVLKCLERALTDYLIKVKI